MVMGLCLLVCALAEHQLPTMLQERDETIPEQVGKPTQSPTMRRVFQVFEGIDLLHIMLGDQVLDRRVPNLSAVQLKVIDMMGVAVKNCYLTET